MNPAILCWRKNVKVRPRMRATNPPADTSQVRTRSDRSIAIEKATARTVLNTGEYHAHPRNTPLNPSAAPATATATAAPITQGWAPGPSRRGPDPGDRTVGSPLPAVPASDPLLRCGARVMAAP